MLELENVTIVQGDPFIAPDLTLTRPVNDYRPHRANRRHPRP